MKTMTNPIAWLRNLDEAGTITKRADRADDVIAEIVDAESRLKALKAHLKSMVAPAEQEALGLGWTAAEIADAKRRATPHKFSTMTGHGKIDTSRGITDWCSVCLKDPSDPVHGAA